MSNSLSLSDLSVSVPCPECGHQLQISFSEISSCYRYGRSRFASECANCLNKLEARAMRQTFEPDGLGGARGLLVGRPGTYLTIEIIIEEKTQSR